MHIPFTIWQSTFHSSCDSPHSIYHRIRTVYTPFIIWQSPLHSSYGSLYSLHSIHHMVVSALFITWPPLFYSSHASLRSIHHMTVCSIHHMPVSILFITWQSAPFIIIMSVLHPTNHFSAYHLVNWATLTMQHLLASGMCMNNITFLCSLSLLITWWTMQHLLVFGMSMKNKS